MLARIFFPVFLLNVLLYQCTFVNMTVFCIFCTYYHVYKAGFLPESVWGNNNSCNTNHLYFELHQRILVVVFKWVCMDGCNWNWLCGRAIFRTENGTKSAILVTKNCCNHTVFIISFLQIPLLLTTLYFWIRAFQVLAQNIY